MSSPFFLTNCCFVRFKISSLPKCEKIFEHHHFWTQSRPLIIIIEFVYLFYIERIESTESVQAMSIERRRCLFGSDPMDSLALEDRLGAYERYSWASCIMECRAKILMERCGCLPFYYPDFGSVWAKDTHCNFTGLECLLSSGEGRKRQQNFCLESRQ